MRARWFDGAATRPGCDIAGHKVCAVVMQGDAILMFRHPRAGVQLVKGGLQVGETAHDAAIRELREESGLSATGATELSRARIGGNLWHFWCCEAPRLPARWEHLTEDDGGHLFQFFWHPIADRGPADCHVIYRIALRIIARHLARL